MSMVRIHLRYWVINHHDTYWNGTGWTNDIQRAIWFKHVKVAEQMQFIYKLQHATINKLTVTWRKER